MDRFSLVVLPAWRKSMVERGSLTEPAITVYLAAKALACHWAFVRCRRKCVSRRLPQRRPHAHSAAAGRPCGSAARAGRASGACAGSSRAPTKRPRMRHATAPGVVGEGERRGHEDERQQRRGDQTAGDRDRHRRTESAAVAEPQRRGNMPAAIAIVVMMIGRARLRPASTRASRRGVPRAISQPRSRRA